VLRSQWHQIERPNRNATRRSKNAWCHCLKRRLLSTANFALHGRFSWRVKVERRKNRILRLLAKFDSSEHDLDTWSFGTIPAMGSRGDPFLPLTRSQPIPSPSRAAFATNGVPSIPVFELPGACHGPQHCSGSFNAAAVTVPFRTTVSAAPCGTPGSRDSPPFTPPPRLYWKEQRQCNPNSSIHQAALFVARLFIRYAVLSFSR